MTNLNTIQQDIANLSPHTQKIIFDLVELLKNQSPPTPTHPQKSPKSNYEALKALGLIGFMTDDDQNLSTNYKQVLAEGWGQKYDHH